MPSQKRAQKKKELKLITPQVAKRIERIIREVLLDFISKDFKTLVRYPILTGGKRLRPALTVISCQALGGKLNDVLYPAAGLEILHNWSLIEDDIIDGSVLRRGEETVWAKFGRSIAQCVGMYFAAATFQGSVNSKKPKELAEIFAKTTKTIIDGEILDILFERAGRGEEPYILKNRFQKIEKKDWKKMAGKKTASLFQTCCEIGGVCAGAPQKKIEVLKKYGFSLGVAFQVKDDILDIFGEEKKFGKKIGKDIEERKGGNIVLLFALEQVKGKDKERILKIMEKKKITEEDKRKVLNLMKKTKALEDAFKLGNDFINRAKSSLKVLPQNKWTKTLEKLADFVIEREK